MGWVVWFVDLPEQKQIGTLWGYSYDDFLNVPADGIIGIVLFEDHYRPDGQPTRLNMAGYDYYFAAEGPIYGVDIEAREVNRKKDIEARYSKPIIARGIWTSNPNMARVQREMEAITWQPLA